MKQKNILFVVAECQKFAQTGGLAEVAGSLPQAIMAKNRTYKVRVMMPLYRCIFKKYQNELKFLGETTIALAWRKLYCGVFTLVMDKVTYYFIDNKYYFDRDNLYGHFDDGERFAFFSKSVFETFPIIGFVPDIIHAHDWHAALVNIYLDILYKKEGFFTPIKSVFTIHNIQYQGIFEMSFLQDIIGIDPNYTDILEYNGLINLMKGAIVTSDSVTTVSPRYAREIQTQLFAAGLENIIRINNDKIVGIINGIDTSFYNPETDENLIANYTADTIHLKLQNKEALQRGLNLEIDPDVCIITVISRLVNLKGLDLVVEGFEEIMKEPVQFIVLGKGDSYYEEKFQEFAKKYPKRVKALIAFDIGLAKKLYGSSDLFLMPSKVEPCGLSQMIACRYGTAPIVRATGGLYDTIKDFKNGEGNGFVFKEFKTEPMVKKIKEAVAVFLDKEKYHKLCVNAMNTDFSWNVSGEDYLSLYKKLLNR